jgi:hypothetical protein
MIKGLIAIAILVALAFLARWVSDEYSKSRKAAGEPTTSSQPAAAPALPPLTPQMEAALAQAKAGGVDAFKVWLDRSGPYLQDPRKADIELDYVQMLARSNPAEARRKFAEVKARVTADSPVYERIKKLEKTFQ